MKKIEAVLRWTGRTLLVLLAILALFILEENLRGRIMLSRYKAELRAKGEKLTLAELNLPEVPKEGNGAAELLAAMDELTSLSKQNPSEAFGLLGWQFTEPGCVRVMVRQDKLEDRRWPVSEAWVSRRPPRGRREPDDGFTNSLPSTAKMADWSELAAVLTSARASLDQIKAATQEPSLAVVIKYGPLYEMRTAHAGRFRSAAQWLAADAVLALHEGQFDDARRSVEAIRRIARALQSDRLTLSQVISARSGEFGLRVTWEALHTDGWTDATLAKWQQLWQGDDGLAGIVASAEVERVLVLQEWAKVARWPSLKELQDGNWGLDGMSVWEATHETARGLLWHSAFLSQDELRLLESWQRQLEVVRAARDTHSRTTAHASLVKLDSMQLQQWRRYDSWRYLLSNAFGPMALDGSLRIQMRFETQRQMTLAAIALKRYELAHSHFPGSLQELVPQYLSELPRDYMDGKPLRYRRANESFALYSVGDDGTDDGGDPTSQPPRKVLYSIWDGRDAVWPQAASE